MDKLEAFVDGSCNPFDKEDTYGSYAYCILEQDNIIEEGAEFVHNTTNNRMELSAILMVLSKVTDVIIYSDSQYCVKGFNEWMHSWKRSNWKNGKVKNIDLWEQMYEYKDSLCKIQWVKGHSKKGMFISTIKGDIHKYNVNHGKSGRYVNVPSIATNSAWVEHNFGDSDSGAILEIYKADSKNIQTIPIWF